MNVMSHVEYETPKETSCNTWGWYLYKKVICLSTTFAFTAGHLFSTLHTITSTSQHESHNRFVSVEPCEFSSVCLALCVCHRGTITNLGDGRANSFLQILRHINGSEQPNQCSNAPHKCRSVDMLMLFSVPLAEQIWPFYADWIFYLINICHCLPFAGAETISSVDSFPRVTLLFFCSFHPPPSRQPMFTIWLYYIIIFFKCYYYYGFDHASNWINRPEKPALKSNAKKEKKTANTKKEKMGKPLVNTIFMFAPVSDWGQSDEPNRTVLITIKISPFRVPNRLLWSLNYLE